VGVVVERLRALLEHPLDPRLARVIVVLAAAVTLGFAALGLLAGGGASRVPATRPRPSGSAGAAWPATARSARGSGSPRAIATRPPRQDPQDRPGSAAQRRAQRELATHRALQHVPYRRGGVSIDLVGARGERAVLGVRAASIAVAHRGWRSFLRRYRDDGRAYLPRFRARGRGSRREG
jgi:hypothetical protein